MDSKHLTKSPDTIWCEKLLCESDMAYHIWGKVTENEKNYAFWIPKSAIIQEEKKLNREVDYSPYSKRPPLEHQKTAIEKLLANDRYILADDMGLGKTTSAIIASLESSVKKILIICPATLKINWQREIENYSDRKTLIVEGRKWGSTFDYYIINYDIVKNYHTVDEPEIGEERNFQIINEKFDLAIVDEAHYISNTTAQRTKLINDILKNIPKVWLLTGTPMTSRPINFYNLLRIVNSNVTLNWQSYVKRYCGGYQFTVNKKKIWNTNGATNLDELRMRTKNLVLRRMKTDILDLPDKIITPVFLDLRSTFYDEELEEFMRITSENKHKESLSVTINRLMKVRQIIAQEKVNYTSELIDKCLEQDKKVIVFTNFTSTLDMLHEKYKKNSVVLDGRMSKEKRQQSVDRFQNESKVKIFISNIIAGGVGITLTEAEVVIMNDLSFVPAHHSQAEDRAFRYGQKKNVLVYYPIFENTIERIVYNMLQKKKNIIDQVMGDGEFSESFAESILKEIL
jgi:SWI/SNF-related matrix-associated actin-dependent regulator 1 of chromatin subfamily A